MTAEILNSKHEIRNKHECSKYKFSKQKNDRILKLEFVSDFDIRI